MIQLWLSDDFNLGAEGGTWKKTSSWCHENVRGLDGNEGGNEKDGGNVVVVEG